MSHTPEDTALDQPPAQRVEGQPVRSPMTPPKAKKAEDKPAAAPLPPGLRPGDLRQSEATDPAPEPSSDDVETASVRPTQPAEESGEHDTEVPQTDIASTDRPMVEDPSAPEGRLVSEDSPASEEWEAEDEPPAPDGAEEARPRSAESSTANGRVSMMPPPPSLLGTPFYDRFAAWTLAWETWNGVRVAARCGEPEAEATILRSACGLIDLSPLTTVRLFGDGAAAVIDRLTTISAATMAEGTVRTALLCAGDGRVIALADVIRLAADEFRLISEVELLPWLEDGARGFPVRVLPETGQYTALGLVGPRVQDVLARCGFLRETSARPGTIVSVARHGVLGRLVVGAGPGGPFGLMGRADLWIEPGDAGTLWDIILRDAGEAVRPMGLDAVETARILAGWPRIGRDALSAELAVDASDVLDPFDLGLEDLIDWDKPVFSGHTALRARRNAGEAASGRLLHLALPGPVQPGAVLRRGREWARLTSAAMCPVTRTWMGIARINGSGIANGGPWVFDGGSFAGGTGHKPALRADRPAVDLRRDHAVQTAGGLSQ